jgi:hypothetical protein
MCVRKTPLAEVFHSSPATTLEKAVACDGGQLMREIILLPFSATAPEKAVACCVVNDQPVGNPKRKV